MSSQVSRPLRVGDGAGDSAAVGAGDPDVAMEEGVEPLALAQALEASVERPTRRHRAERRVIDIG
jgi:hypothetical protein